jgi:hypothetical protein
LAAIHGEDAPVELSWGEHMVRVALAAVCVAGLGIAAPPAQASVFTDDLSRCLVIKTSESDKLTLVRWIFSAIAGADGVKDLTKVNEQQRETLARESAEIFTRLITKDCRTETGAAIKNDGAKAVETSFGVLGEIAMQGLMGDESVVKNMGRVDKYFDKKALTDFGRELTTSTQPKI